MNLRDRISLYLSMARDNDTRSLLRDVLRYMDQPHDLDWVRDKFGLSPAEFNVLTLLAEGKSRQAIAEQLGNSVGTIAVQISSIYRRVGVGNMTELMALLLRRSAA